MPRKDFLSAVLGLSLAVWGVSAGNAWFEPLNRFSSSSISNQPFETITANDTIRDPFARGSEEAPEKRWVAVQPDTKTERTPYELWPDKTIKFCFEDTESRGRLYDLIIKGMDLWYQAGLDSDFKMTEVSDSDCKNKRSEVMLVSLGDGLSTTPARSAESSMVLTVSDVIGMQNVISNVAHEIGHAWGLFHEHQNPSFWNGPYVGQRTGKLFGESNFHCKNLKDYDAVIAKIQKMIDDDPGSYNVINLEIDKNEICKKRVKAIAYGFSASEYLPLDDIDKYTVETEDISLIDWDSIMLYPSGAGGTDLGNGERLPILTRPNGDEIGLNLLPSSRDIAGLTALYGSDNKYDEVLYSEAKSSKNKKFNLLRNKDTGVCD